MFGKKNSTGVKRKRAKKSRIYFGKETENAIVSFNECEDQALRDEIYRTKIQVPMDKLADNIVSRWPFEYLKEVDQASDIKHQVVGFLISNIDKYDQSKGKAFSYFSVMAKNWLIHHDNLTWKNRSRMISLSDQSDGEYSVEEILNLHSPHDIEDESDQSELFTLLIDYWEKNASKIFEKPRDQSIALAVVQLIRKAKTLEIFNKKAVYLMVREMTDQESSHITKVLSRMTEDMKKQIKCYYTTGLLEPRTPNPEIVEKYG